MRNAAKAFRENREPYRTGIPEDPGTMVYLLHS